jgi:SAM-dependent methyltransferase
VATDISDVLLEEAWKAGLLPAYGRENAEALSFEDGRFDYVFCKESLHHVPRPFVALHEMLRVARKGVVLIEPNDRFESGTLLSRLVFKAWRLGRACVGLKVARDGYEECGNYIYCIAKREIEKVCLALDLCMIAFKGVNDHYEEGLECEKVAENGVLLRKVKRRIFAMDLAAKMGLMESRLLAVAIFKEEPSAGVVARLGSAGYQVKRLTRNPSMHPGERSE